MVGYRKGVVLFIVYLNLARPDVDAGETMSLCHCDGAFSYTTSEAIKYLRLLTWNEPFVYYLGKDGIESADSIAHL